MLDSLKRMVVVLTIAFVIFVIVRPMCLRFMSAEDFARRRNVWFTLTCVGFLSPSFWLFAAIAIPLLVWATSKDSHPTALYLFVLLAVPPVALDLPLVIVNKLFDLTTYRVLALGVLIPTAARLRREGASKAPGLVKVDLLLLMFGALQLAVYAPYESLTNTLRRAVLFGLDTYLVYYVFSRGATTRTVLRDTMACLCVTSAVLAPIAVLEALKHWLLFDAIPANWGVPYPFAWLMRGDALRAQASTGHALVLGYFCAAAIGFYLYVGNQLESKRRLWAGVGLLLCGLLATSSRAPLFVAVVIAAIFLVVAPSGRRGFVGAVAASIAISIPLLMSPIGARIIDTLPFIGKADQFNVQYREQLASLSWRLILQNPFFGDPFAMRFMEQMRQGQGIIDLVNTYASIALFNGFVGCALFVGCLAYPLLRTMLALYALDGADRESADMGTALAATMIGTLLMLATTSLGLGVEMALWALAGLCCAYPAAMRRLSPSRSTAVYATAHPTMGSMRMPQRPGR